MGIFGTYKRIRSKHSEGVKLIMKMTTVTIAVAVVLMISGNAQAVQVSPSQGLDFEQLDFLFTAATVYDSDWGGITANPVELHDHYGISSGYINVYTDKGWVVQNLPVDLTYGSDPITTYFSLGLSTPQNVSTLSAYVNFTLDPQLTFADGPRSSFYVGAGGWNAEGVGDSQVTDIGTAPPGNLVFTLGGLITVHIQPMPANVQTAKNQCFPMSIANSLQYLENRFVGINIPNEHKMGLKGDNTLVGKLDTAANRIAPTRVDGCGTTFEPMVSGKFSYLNEIGMKDKLIHKHQGRGFGTPAGDFQSSGITSKYEGAKVTWEWISNEIKNGEDVELVYAYYNRTGHIVGGHAVRVYGCGEILGLPYILFLHDRLQTDKDIGDNKGLKNEFSFVLDIDGDGNLNLGSKQREIAFALSESAPPGTPEIPEFPTIAVPVAAVIGLMFLFSRRSRYN